MVEKPNPEDCEHVSVNRTINSWYCNNRGAEFRPVKKEHVTKWKR